MPNEIAPVPAGYPGFLLQIVRQDGSVVRIPAGGALEGDLIDLCVHYICAKPVGLFHTAAQVEIAVRQGLVEALMAYKLQAGAVAHTAHPGVVGTR
jgi:hypothetical protein